MKEKIKVFIIEDHTFTREGIKSILTKSGIIDVLGESDNVEDGYKGVIDCNPDILLLDISLHGSSGLVLAKKIIAAMPNLKIIIITAFSKVDYILEAVENGINGYILKESPPENLPSIIEKVFSGEVYIDSYVANKVIKSLINKNDIELADESSAYGKLTLREQQIMKMLVDGFSVKEIADELFISVRTAENHKANIMVKLECKNIIELIKYAVSIGLIDV